MTYVLNDRAECLVAIYRQLDGYPHQPGMGYDIYDILYNRELCNGFNSKEDWQGSSNGMEDLAAFMVNRLKNISLIGTIYLEVPPVLASFEPQERYLRVLHRNAEKHLAEYFYVVYPDKTDPSKIRVMVYEVGRGMLFDGFPHGMHSAFAYHPPSNCGAIVEEPQT